MEILDAGVGLKWVLAVSDSDRDRTTGFQEGRPQGVTT